MTPVLALQGIAKRYPGVQALSDVSFEVAAGRVHALLGENGAGKSTLIRIVSGSERPDAGGMRLAGRPYQPRSPADGLVAGVSTLYQEQNLLPHRSVAHNVLLGDEPRRLAVFVDRAALHRETARLLDRLHAGHIAPDAVVAALSPADRQLVDIAKALRRRSRLLIMDEPTAALTSREADALFAVVAGLRDDGISVLLVSHRLDEVFRIADDLTVLRDGAHVRTSSAAGLVPDDVVAAMIGRDPETAFPVRLASATGAALLEAERITGPSFAGVSLQVRAGEVLAVAGVTGSGKQELGMALAGAVPLRSGRLLVDGRPVRLNPRRAVRLGIALVPADRKAEGIVEELAVQRNLALPALDRVSAAGMLRPARERVLAVRQVDELRIRTRDLRTPVRQLSGGNQQKVALGKWLTLRPRVLVLLEPTQGIDVGVRFEFYRLIRELAAAGTGVVLVSSDVPEVLGVADRIVVLRNGRPVAEMEGSTATAEQLLRHSLGQTATQP